MYIHTFVNIQDNKKIVDIAYVRIHMCVHAYIYTCVRTYTHNTCVHTRTCKHTYQVNIYKEHKNSHISVHTYMHTYMHTGVPNDHI